LLGIRLLCIHLQRRGIEKNDVEFMMSAEGA